MNKPHHTNHLIQESSPYLLQHAHNPVNWYPWGKEALTKAKEQDKLLLISIGYSACHWCHVMEKESFENEQIAEIMNRHFICIKVDREERPDIDQIYMEAVQIINGNGGWPLNCFALPDGRPVYGGTYFKPNHWVQILSSLSTSYLSEKKRFNHAADEILQGIKGTEIVHIGDETQQNKIEDLIETIEPLKKQFDTEEGGNKRAPKFPMPNLNRFLLNYFYHTKDESIMEHLRLTLDKMMMGGIYDQIGGGFARYSVDRYWKVPHFEKMIYDNSQLVSLYSKAFQLTKNETYKRKVHQTLEFIERELSTRDGAFYSSIDADSQGVEGKYYIWEKKEIERILGADSEIICDYYSITKEGNWEHQKNIPICTNKLNELQNKFQLTEFELIEKLDLLNKILLEAREKRIRPGLDDKVLSSWNALMLKAYVDAFNAFGKNSFLDKALLCAEFLSKKMIDQNYRIWRNYKNEKVTINGFLDDYAFTIDSFTSVYQATFDEKWLIMAKNLTNYTIEHFFDNKTGLFFYTSDIDEELITRKKEIYDNVIPSSNSVMANNLFNLGLYFYENKYTKMSAHMLSTVKKEMKQNGMYYSNWANLLLKFVYPPFQIAIVGMDAYKIKALFNQKFIPTALFAGSIESSELPMLKERKAKEKTTIYVCQNQICKIPVYTVEDAFKLMEYIEI